MNDPEPVHDPMKARLVRGERLLIRHHRREQDEADGRDEGDRDRHGDRVQPEPREEPVPGDVARRPAPHGDRRPNGGDRHGYSSSSPMPALRIRFTRTTVKIPETMNSTIAIADA